MGAALSVRKRRWATRAGEEKEAWIADYVDAGGTRRLRTFDRKKDAEQFLATATVQIREGTHVADSASITVAKAGELWLQSAEQANLERATRDQYRQHLDIHIRPMLGRLKLSQLNAPTVRAFEDRLRAEGRSPTLTRYVLRSLGAILSDAQERGLTSVNVVRSLRSRRRKGEQNERRQKGKLKVGIDIPTPDEIRRIVHTLQGNRYRPFLLTAVFTGLRASELRGLTWADVDIERREVHVRQRADRYHAIGRPKTHAGERTVPLPPILVNTLREWRVACPKGELGLVFPNAEGNIEWHANIISRGLIPVQIEAGVIDASGHAKYTGLHSLRHFYASWCINRPEDGGLGLSPKMVQARMGHSSIVVTLDTYAHLFPADDAGELAAAEKALLG